MSLLIWQRAQAGVARQAVINQKRHDDGIRHQPHVYKVGEVRLKIHVLKSGVSAKLSDRWSELFEVVEVRRNNIGILRNGKVKTINGAHVKPAEIVRTVR